MKYSGVSVIMRSQPKGVNLLKPKTYLMYHQLEHSETLCSAHTVYLCFAWLSEQAALIFLYNINILVLKPRQGVFTARYGLGLYIKQIQFRP